MTAQEIKAAILQMQYSRPLAAKVWQNPNGTFSHHKDAKREWSDESGCRTDLRFAEEWER